MSGWVGSDRSKKQKERPPRPQKTPAKALPSAQAPAHPTVDVSAVARRTRVKAEFIKTVRGKPFVKYEGILDLAHAMGLTHVESSVIELTKERCVIRSVVTLSTAQSTRTFTGFGEATVNEKRGEKGDSIDMNATIVRIAETRAKARALRDATNVGVTAWEEIDTELEGEE